MDIYGPTFSNDGSIWTANYAGTRGGLNLCDDLTLVGSSPFVLDEGMIVSKGSVRRLTIDADQSLAGVTYLGVSGGADLPVNITNDGELITYAKDYALYAYGYTDCVNNNLIVAEEVVATGTSQIRLYGHWDNTYGTLLAEGGAQIQFYSYDTDGDMVLDGSLDGGVFETEGSGEIQIMDIDFVVSNVTNNGYLHIPAYCFGSLWGLSPTMQHSLSAMTDT